MSAVSHNKTLTMADFTGTVTVFNSTGGATSIAATDLWRPSNVNSAHDQFVSLSGNTSNLSATGPVSNVVLAGGNNITLSMVTAANAATVSIVGALQGQDFRPTPMGNSSTWLAVSNNTLNFVPLFPENNVFGSIVQFPVSMSFTTSTNTRNFSVTFSMCLYQQDIGASSTQITSQSSVSGSIGVSRASNSATYRLAINGSSSSTAQTDLLTGAYIVEMPMVTTMLAGNSYYLGMAGSTSSSGATGYSFASMGMVNTNVNFGEISGGTVTQIAGSLAFDFDGYQYSSTSGAWPGTVPFSSLSRAASGLVPYVEFINR